VVDNLTPVARCVLYITVGAVLISMSSLQENGRRSKYDIGELHSN
jgi:hypothetical protein